MCVVTPEGLPTERATAVRRGEEAMGGASVHEQQGTGRPSIDLPKDVPGMLEATHTHETGCTRMVRLARRLFSYTSK